MLLMMIVLIFLLILCIIAGIVFSYKSNHPEKYFGGKVYECDLYYVGPEIEVWLSKSKSENIIKADKIFVDKILVQKTYNENYVREIISGKIIPVSCKCVRYNHDQTTSTYYNNYESTTFVSISKKIIIDCREEIKGFTEVTFAQLEQYVQTRKEPYRGYNSFELYLDAVFKKGESHYDNGRIMMTDEEKIQRLLKDL